MRGIDVCVSHPHGMPLVCHSFPHGYKWAHALEHIRGTKPLSVATGADAVYAVRASVTWISFTINTEKHCVAAHVANADVLLAAMHMSASRVRDGFGTSNSTTHRRRTRGQKTHPTPDDCRFLREALGAWGKDEQPVLYVSDSLANAGDGDDDREKNWGNHFWEGMTAATCAALLFDIYRLGERLQDIDDVCASRDFNAAAHRTRNRLCETMNDVSRASIISSFSRGAVRRLNNEYKDRMKARLWSEERMRRALWPGLEEVFMTNRCVLWAPPQPPRSNLCAIAAATNVFALLRNDALRDRLGRYEGRHVACYRETVADAYGISQTTGPGELVYRRRTCHHW